MFTFLSQLYLPFCIDCVEGRYTPIRVRQQRSELVIAVWYSPQGTAARQNVARPIFGCQRVRVMAPSQPVLLICLIDLDIA